MAVSLASIDSAAMTSPARATARSSPGAEAPWVGSPGAGSPDPAVTPGSQKVGGRAHLHRVRQALHQEIGRASWRERVCRYVKNWVVAVTFKKKKSEEAKH